MKKKYNKKRGLFIVFEGIDGSGKTTQARMLSECFQNKRVPTVFTNEPSESVIGKEIRDSLVTGNKTQAELAKMFVEDRQLHLKEVILPALEEGKHVICDRYFYSNIAYQGASGLSLELLKKQNADFIKPDFLFFFKIPVDVALQRVQKRKGAYSIFEKKVFLEKVRDNYVQLQREEKNSYLIDAEKSVEEIYRIIKGYLIE